MLGLSTNFNFRLRDLILMIKSLYDSLAYACKYALSKGGLASFISKCSTIVALLIKGKKQLSLPWNLKLTKVLSKGIHIFEDPEKMSEPDFLN